MPLPSLRPSGHCNLPASDDVSPSGHQTNLTTTSEPGSRFEVFNFDVSPDPAEATDSTECHNPISSDDRKSSRRASQTQLDNLWQTLGRLETLRDEINNSNWSHDAKVVFGAAIKAHEEALKALRNPSLPADGANSSGPDQKDLKKSLDYEEATVLQEREGEFYRYLADVRKKAQAIFDNEASEKEKRRKSMEKRCEG